MDLERYFDFSPECLCVLDSDWSVNYCNESFEKSVGALKMTQGLKFVDDLVGPAQREAVKTALKLVDGTIIHNVDTLIFELDNKYPIFRKFDWSFVKVPKSTKIVASGRLMTVVDTNRRSAEDEFRDFFDKAPIALHWLSGTGHVLWANEREMEVLGYTAEEYIGQPIMNFCPDEEERVLEIFKQLGSGNTIHDVPVRFRAKDGSIKHLLIDSNVNWNPDGTFKHTRCFIRDDTGRKIREARFEVEKEAALEIAKSKDEFLRKVFHEVRSPVHIALQSLQLQETVSGKERKELLNCASEQVRHIVDIMEDLESATLFDQGKVPIVSNFEFSLYDTCKSIVDGFNNGRVNSKEVSLVLDFSSETPSCAKGDKKLLSRVLRHLLGNSLKFTEKGEVILKVTVDPPSLTDKQNEFTCNFEVTDTGKGVDVEIVNKIFQKYWAGTSCGFEQMDGLGLGLNVSYNIIQCMGGCLKVSPNEPKGATFTFSLNFNTAETFEITQTSEPTDWTLPSSLGTVDELMVSCGSEKIKQSSNMENPLTIPRQVKNKTFAYEVNQLDDNHSSTLNCVFGWMASLKKKREPHESQWSSVYDSPQAARHISDANKNKDTQINMKPGIGISQLGSHILVVDDNTICQKVALQSLQHLGCTGDVASNGREACDKLQRNPLIYNAVLMDLRMPIMDGIAATEYVRKVLNLQIPIIAFSAEYGDDTRSLCNSVGMNGFVPKPARRDDLKAVLLDLKLVKI